MVTINNQASSEALYRVIIDSPVGSLFCAAADNAVVSILFECGTHTYGSKFNPILLSLKQQLDEYFSGSLREFNLPVALCGTPHQLKVWERLLRIPYGETTTYAGIAKTLGSAPIAVGQAVGKNRLNIIVPCHRVIGSNGSLTGYGGGLPRKKHLLELETT